MQSDAGTLPQRDEQAPGSSPIKSNQQTTATASPLLPVEAADVLHDLVVPCMVAVCHVEARDVHAVVSQR